MRDFPSSSLGLEGALLIAHPTLLDPNFRRTVLYLVSHDAEEGALGIVLNRAMDKTVKDLLALPDLGALGAIPVFSGGPVSRDRMTFAVFEWERETQTVVCRLNVDLEEAKELAEEGEAVVRAFVGYAGWSGGQLEAELEQKAWVVQKPDREVLDPESCKRMWAATIRNYGPWFQLLAEAPDDPSLN
ncbi:MAG: YqgE/AlgH family protein [Chthoniobacteraceae bacterium]|nr:YqgE/AlgH family protein [Chthoniobacteraceae bacterium]